MFSPSQIGAVDSHGLIERFPQLAANPKLRGGQRFEADGSRVDIAEFQHAVEWFLERRGECTVVFETLVERRQQRSAVGQIDLNPFQTRGGFRVQIRQHEQLLRSGE